MSAEVGNLTRSFLLRRVTPKVFKTPAVSELRRAVGSEMRHPSMIGRELKKPTQLQERYLTMLGTIVCRRVQPSIEEIIEDVETERKLRDVVLPADIGHHVRHMHNQESVVEIWPLTLYAVYAAGYRLEGSPGREDVVPSTDPYAPGIIATHAIFEELAAECDVIGKVSAAHPGHSVNPEPSGGNNLRLITR